MIDRITGIFTGMLAGYLTGMVIGFTVFDPEWDVWALLGAALALVGMGVGLLPLVRHNRSVILGAITGFYLGWLLNFLVFGDTPENGMDLFQNGIGGFLCTLSGTVIGTWLGIRYRSEALGLTLFAAAFGGFLGGLGVGLALGVGPASSMLTWAVPVIVTGTVLGSLVWQIEARRTA